MIHTKKEVKTETQLIYNKYKTHGDMKLAVKIFGMGNKRIINITQHKERKLSLLSEMEVGKAKSTLLKLRKPCKIKHVKVNIRQFCTTYLKETSNYTI